MSRLDNVAPDTSLQWDSFSLVSLQNICKGRAGIQDIHTISLCSSGQAVTSKKPTAPEAPSIILVAAEHRDNFKRSFLEKE